MNLRVFYLTRRGLSDGYLLPSSGDDVSVLSSQVACFVMLPKW